ncbi:spore germination protein [Virgibacillus kekensis]|uniref:Spore germination protein n=1 Tax=Virgibacillus kekensis TaxID=202261 RepID=A0ABV9DR85_9BACI
MSARQRKKQPIFKRRKTKQSDKGQITESSNPGGIDAELPSDLAEAEEILRNVYENCSDVMFRSFYIDKKHKALLVYIEGLVNGEELDENVLSPLFQGSDMDSETEEVIYKRLPVSTVKQVRSLSDCIGQISTGNPVILVDKENSGFSVGLSKWDKRAIEEPTAETVVRGPREGFVETISVNTSLIRRKIHSPKLKMMSLNVGDYTETKVIITFVEGLADQTLIDEVTNRISRLNIDGVLESGVLEEFIEDNPHSPFPQILSTERPDVVAANLLEGRVGIIVDGSPHALVVPVTFYSFLQASEDYYQRYIIGTSIRLLRYLFLLISLFLPSMYVALLTFHQEMIPTSLLISIAASREQVPFPALIEALMMEITFEALREAGLRLPKQIGSAVSIVGALVIGEAAVSAGIVSAPMVIVVALTGVASFTIPRYSASAAIRMLRFPMIILAGTLGLLGIILGIITIVVHMATIRSFGEPYLSPMAPMKKNEMKDVLMRAPWWKLDRRPHFTGQYNKYRQSGNQRPFPDKGKE